MTQVVNDQMIDELRASFFHKRRELWLLANNDVRPNDDRRGLAARFVTQSGLTTWTSHFRTGDAAGAGELASYSWINDGTFGGAPAGLLEYSRSSEYLRARPAGAANRHFLARTITNAAANWQNIYIRARIAAYAGPGSVGIRVDSGADGGAGDFYIEIYAAAVATYTYTITFRYRINGAGAVTVATTVVLPHTFMVPVQLKMDYTGAVYTGVPSIIGEDGSGAPAGGSTPAVTAYLPSAGRAGIICNSDALGTGIGLVDWFYDEFT